MTSTLERMRLINKELVDSERTCRCYGYLARPLGRRNDALQGIGVPASFISIFTLLGGLCRFALDSLILATLSFAVPTLRNDSDRSLRSAEITRRLARLHLEWEHLSNAAPTRSNRDLLSDSKNPGRRRFSILEHVPLDLTLPPSLARRARNTLREDCSRSPKDADRSTAGAGSQVRPL